MTARLLTGSVYGFSLALLALVGMVFVILAFGWDGETVILAIGGVGETKADEALAWAAACDTLLPIGYGAGFCLLGIGLDRGLAGGAVVALASVGVAADFIENAMVLAYASPITTGLKFGALGLSGFILVTLLPGGTKLQMVAKAVGWVGMPLSFAASHLVEPSAILSVLSLAATFGLLALVARQVSR
ncbi:hypothetical protein [Jannaschia aquimarina]|uniref:Uncharacterized protein n=1 Tax=Jannaschia aquimarina TaxID=935700 RepID=A0A0D1D4K7_9RHOB|nr:hypothetical protein [Jannaschia aquimarina]KIT15008.1 hypothetical protein jaqu_33330 [Jannaschia aquimarina]SNS61835.1 hypothetical protein SAMN05421775_101659 [Jannaschia aquimarina]